MNKRSIKAWLMLLAVLVASMLYLSTLGRKSLWLDENATLRISSMRVTDILFNRPTSVDPHPPLYYLLMHYWAQISLDAFILRLPSAIAGIAAIPLLYRTVRMWSDRWSGVASAWLLVIAPLHIWYSQEVRMYALVCTLSLASTFFYTLAIRQENPLAWIAWIVTTTAGLYTDYSMMLIIIGQIILLVPLWKLYNTQAKARWPAFIALPTALFLSTPTIYIFVTELVAGGGEAGYYTLIQSLLSAWSIEIPQAQLHTITLLAGAIVLGITAAAAYMLPSLLKRVRVGMGFVIVAITLYLLIVVASAIPRGMLLKRQLLVFLPYGLGGVAALLSTSSRRPHLLAALILVTLPVTGHVIAVREQEAWRDAVQFVEENAQPDDVILFNAWYAQPSFEYYYRGDLLRQGIRVKDATETLPNITASHRRVWLVLSQDKLTDPQGDIQSWFDENCTLIEEHILQGVRVRLYDAGESP